MNFPNIVVDEKKIEILAKKWHINEFALFGSVLGESYTEESDIDVLIQFEPDTNYGLFDLVDLKEELETLLGRSVDLVKKSSIKNPFREKEILRTARVIYAA